MCSKHKYKNIRSIIRHRQENLRSNVPLILHLFIYKQYNVQTFNSFFPFFIKIFLKIKIIHILIYSFNAVIIASFTLKPICASARSGVSSAVESIAA